MNVIILEVFGEWENMPSRGKIFYILKITAFWLYMPKIRTIRAKKFSTEGAEIPMQ